jgi:hypothetical protein
MKDFYNILGVEADSTLSEIKDAYRKLSVKFHPDLNQGDDYFESRFREINEAYQTLGDPQNRMIYDAALKKAPVDSIIPAVNDPYRAKRPDLRRFKRKGLGVGMTLMLILIGLVFGAYIIESVITTKPVRTIPVVAIKTIAFHPHKKHRKHYSKYRVAADSVKHSGAIENIAVKPAAKAEPIKAIIIAPKVIKPMAIKPKPVLPDSNRNIHKDYLYATYVHSNVTGIVNMRADGNYGSPVVETIPANSKVQVLAKGGSYYRVRFNNYTGYVPRWSLVAK